MLSCGTNTFRSKIEAMAKESVHLVKGIVYVVLVELSSQYEEFASLISHRSVHGVAEFSQEFFCVIDALVVPLYHCHTVMK